ncbi:MAG: hypothetical protein RL109_56 [Pseudomonadota bacterium]|jgi:integration host factor subunit beta
MSKLSKRWGSEDAPQPVPSSTSASEAVEADGLSIAKSELIAKLAEKYPQLAARDAELAVRTLLDAMTRTLVEGRRIEIRGFGSFALSTRPPRTGRNPKSGEAVSVPEKRVPHFKPGKELRQRVDQAAS